MGTSVNQRSPDTDNWRIVQDLYVDPELEIDDALKMIWRAASNPNEANLFELLSRPEIGQFAEFAQQYSEPVRATAALRTFISAEKVSSLASDIASRAVAQSAGKENSRAVYAERLFAEATSYLVARDLPGYVGSSDRFENIADAHAFIGNMAGRAAAAARQTVLPANIDQAGWRSYVQRVVLAIRGAQ